MSDVFIWGGEVRRGHTTYVLNLIIKYTDGRYRRGPSFRDGPFGDCPSRNSTTGIPSTGRDLRAGMLR